MGFIDRAKELIGVKPEPIKNQRPRSLYMRGGRHSVFSAWNPALRSDQSDIGMSWSQAAARTADAIHNSGWLAGAIEQAKANTVGTGLMVRPSPENAEFGMSDDEARAWINLVSRRFALWAQTPLECDLTGQRTLYQQQVAVFGSWLATGEILAEIVYRPRSLSYSGTKVRLMSPTRISRRSDPFQRIINGVQCNADGMPIALLAKRAGKQAGALPVDQLVRMRDRYGRPRVIHVFTGAPETYRGITPLVPALQVIRQFDQLSDATLTAATVQTLFAASIKSSSPTEEVLQGLLTPKELAEMSAAGGSPLEAYLDMAAGFYEGMNLDLGVSGRLAHLFPGQELEFHSPNHPSDNYGPFSADLKREFARCLGMTYESATGDYSNATYASLGRGIAEIFEITKMRRTDILQPFTQPIYSAWLEEEIERGFIYFPGGIENFLRHRAAATRMVLTGGAKPIAEELKTAKAHEVWLKNGLKSRTVICAEMGLDYEDVLVELGSEKEMRAQYGVPEPDAGEVTLNSDPDDDDEGGDDNA